MKLLLCAISVLVALPLGSGQAPHANPVEEVEAVLTDFHAAANEGDVDRYLGHLASDAILLGTDATERWSFAVYEALVRPAMEQGTRITSTPTEQNVFVSADGKMAWFDERLEKPKYGELRGTGVLRRTEAGWKIVQLNVTLPVPNDVIQDVVKLIRAAKRR